MLYAFVSPYLTPTLKSRATRTIVKYCFCVFLKIKIPIRKVKIDKTIVDNYLVQGKENFILNISHLVHDLGMDLTVEGIEQKWQFDMLKELNCDYIQGYYFSKPEKFQVIKEMI